MVDGSATFPKLSLDWIAVLVALGLASLGFVSLGLPEGLLGVAWPSIRATFGLPIDALGMLLATFASGYFVASAINGRVLARFGVGPVLSVSCATTGVLPRQVRAMTAGRSRLSPSA